MNDASEPNTELPDGPQPAEPSVTPPQFGLQTMFIAITIGSLLLAVFSWYGGHAAAIIVLCMGVAVFLESAIFGLRRWYLLGYSVVGFCVGLLWFASLNLPTAAEARAQTQLRLSMQNLLQIKYALMNYEDLHGRYPPIAALDSQGHPAHSWRAFILPQLELERLGVEYDFREAWDSPRNSGWKPTTLESLSNTRRLPVSDRDDELPGHRHSRLPTRRSLCGDRIASHGHPVFRAARCDDAGIDEAADSAGLYANLWSSRSRHAAASFVARSEHGVSSAQRVARAAEHVVGFAPRELAGADFLEKI